MEWRCCNCETPHLEEECQRYLEGIRVLQSYRRSATASKCITFLHVCCPFLVNTRLQLFVLFCFLHHCKLPTDSLVPWQTDIVEKDGYPMTYRHTCLVYANGFIHPRVFNQSSSSVESINRQTNGSNQQSLLATHQQPTNRPHQSHPTMGPIRQPTHQRPRVYDNNQPFTTRIKNTISTITIIYIVI